MECALKTAFINTFPTQAAGPATCVPPSTCPLDECALGHGQGCPLVWARCPRETSQGWPQARGTGSRALPTPPSPAALTPGCSLGRCPGLRLPARPLGAPRPLAPSQRHRWVLLLPRPTSQVPTRLPTQPCPRQVWPSLCSLDVQEGTALTLALPLPGTQGSPRAAEEEEGSIYLRSLRAAAAGGHRRSGWSGHSASRRAPQEWDPPAEQTQGVKEPGGRALQPRPSGPQRRHNLP